MVHTFKWNQTRSLPSQTKKYSPVFSFEVTNIKYSYNQLRTSFLSSVRVSIQKVSSHLTLIKQKSTNDRKKLSTFIKTRLAY